MTINRVEIVIETSEAYIIKRKCPGAEIWCHQRNRKVNSISIAKIASLNCQDTKKTNSL
jgi:hypothetical protein